MKKQVQVRVTSAQLISHQAHQARRRDKQQHSIQNTKTHEQQQARDTQNTKHTHKTHTERRLAPTIISYYKYQYQYYYYLPEESVADTKEQGGERVHGFLP